MSDNTIIADIDKALEPCKKMFFSNKLYQHIINKTITLDLYKAMMQETYHFVKYTVPHLELAAAKLKDVDSELADVFSHHAREEAGHERWALEDLAELGVDIEKVKSADPLPQTMSLIAYKYYTIEQINPKAIIGLEYAMEGLTAKEGSGAVDTLKEALNLDDKALRFFIRHVKVDAGHVDDDIEIIEKFIKTDEEKKAVIRNATDFMILYGAMYSGICDHLGM